MNINQLKQLLSDRYKIIRINNSYVNVLNRDQYTNNNSQQYQNQIKQTFQHYNNYNKNQFIQINQKLNELTNKISNIQRQMDLNNVGLKLYWNGVCKNVFIFLYIILIKIRIQGVISPEHMYCLEQDLKNLIKFIYHINMNIFGVIGVMIQQEK